MKVIQVAMKEDLLRRITREAKARRLTRAALIREACQHYLEKLREDDLDRQYVAGYLRHPESAAVGKTGERLAAEVWPREDWQ
jgi:metal-responsive CopG/Arc/MetJ family transcriptional regulator